MLFGLKLAQDEFGKPRPTHCVVIVSSPSQQLHARSIRCNGRPSLEIVLRALPDPFGRVELQPGATADRQKHLTLFLDKAI